MIPAAQHPGAAAGGNGARGPWMLAQPAVQRTPALFNKTGYPFSSTDINSPIFAVFSLPFRR